MTSEFITKAKQWARTLKRDVYAIWLAGRDRRTPWLAKLLALTVAGCALSPIDLIHDFIPIVGYLDDLIIVPLGIMLIVRVIPTGLLAEHRKTASEMTERPVSRVAAIVIVAVWIVCLSFLTLQFYRPGE